MPASASRRQARTASGVHSSGWVKWMLSHSGWCLRSILTSAGVMRWGITTGTLVPMRTNCTWGIERSSPSSQSSLSSERVSGSPPDSSTSRICGVRRM